MPTNGAVTIGCRWKAVLMHRTCKAAHSKRKQQAHPHARSISCLEVVRFHSCKAVGTQAEAAAPQQEAVREADEQPRETSALSSVGIGIFQRCSLQP